MAAAIFESCFLIICLLICSSGAQEKISAELGQDVILPCKVPNKKIKAAEWIRPDLDPDHVLVYRNGRIDSQNQHPSYQNRVDLQDKEMKDGNASLILKNVTKNDTGTYECWVFEKEKYELINNISLEVYPSGDKDGNIGDGGNKIGIIVGSVVVGILVAAASVVSWLYSPCRRHNQHRSVPPDEQLDPVTVPEHHQNQVQLVSV